LIVVIALVAGGGRSSKATPAAAAPPPASDLVQRAASLVNAGDSRQAVRLLEKELPVPPRPEDASAYIVLGHARLALERRLDGLAAYESAMRLAPELAKDQHLLANIQSVLDSHDVAAAMVALELLATRVSPPALDVIAAQASNAKLADVRHRAIAIAEREGAADKIDRIASWSLDLQQSTDCEERRSLIARLRAAGDKRALEALRRAKATKCIAHEAADAIAALESAP
jgi:tetratricopeptide (TPR) repeat protein